MAIRRSLGSVIKDLDISKVSVDEYGRVVSEDPQVLTHLAELRDILGVSSQVAPDPNGSQCYCGGGGDPIQSGCPS